MALINEKSAFETQNGTICNTLNNQVSCFFSQISLLNTRINFKSENEFTNDENEDSDDDDYPTSVKKLRKKYNVLTAPTSADYQQTNNKSRLTYTTNRFPNSPSIKVKVVSSPQKSNNHDGNELGEPKCVLYPREKINLEWRKVMKIGSGLSNIGNTCFMNSVLQSLTYCPPLVNYLISLKDEHPSKCRLTFCMICLMLKHVSLALSRENSVIKPIYICQRLKSIAKHFTFGRQEDAHEFLRYVIDHMWRACLAFHEHEFGIPGLVSKSDHLTKATTAINHIFGGYHRSQVLCMQCKAKSNTYDYFMDFMLDIQNVSSLEEALRNFVNPEFLRNDNAYKCLKCKKSVVAKKQFTVYRAPNVATFQLKRFDCSRMFGKIVKFVSYPEILDLRPYMSESGPPLIYKLISVLVHQGNTCNSGHYYCYVRNSNNFWYMMDDSSVSQVGLNEVLNQKAYILFYIRFSTNEKPEKNILSKTNVQITLNNKISPNNSSSKSDNQLFQNTNNTNKIFNPNFKFSLNLKPATTITTTTTTTSNHYNKSLDDNNNVKTNNPKQESKKSNVEIKNECPTKVTLMNSSATNESSNILSSNGLVPYDDEHDSKPDINSNFNKNRTNVEKINKTEHNEDSTSIKNETINIKDPKTSIPILKVKATTNSWQVVETSSINNHHSSSEKNKIKLNSNWKISKTTNKDENKNFHIESNSSDNQGFENFKRKNKHCNDNSGDIKRISDINDIKKISKDKTKKRKRKKAKSKKRKHFHDDSDESDDNVELNWVERTKETLEVENKNALYHQMPAQKDEVANISNKKVKLSMETSTASTSSKSNIIIDVLLKNASNGYNEVKTWNGGISNLHKAINQDRRKSCDDNNDLYNQEFDQGKTIKVKNKVDQFNMLKSNSSQVNPFQAMQQAKYSSNNNNGDKQNNGKHHYIHHFSSNNNLKKVKFKFNSCDDLYFNNKNKYYNKSNSNNRFSFSSNYHHSSSNSSSSSSSSSLSNRNNKSGTTNFYAKNNFKCR